MIKYFCEQTSEEWFSLRLGRVTGTSFKSLMATKTTAAYSNLIADIAAEKISNKSDDCEGYENEFMQRGKELEPEARQLYEHLFNCKIEQVGFVTPNSENKYFHWVGVSPDGLTEDEGMIEIKCPKRSTHWYYLFANKMPSEYYWQVQGQLFVTKLKYCDFISYYPDLKPFIIRVLPDEKAFKRIEDELDVLILEVEKQIKIYNKYSFLNEE